MATLYFFVEIKIYFTYTCLTAALIPQAQTGYIPLVYRGKELKAPCYRVTILHHLTDFIT